MKQNITHNSEYYTYRESIEYLIEKIRTRGDLPHATVKKQLQIVEELSAFPFGRYVLEHKGANGYWTDYLMHHPKNGRITGLNIEGKPFSPLENFMLNRSPIVVSTQDRFQIFQNVMQKMLKNNISIASIPCGAMRDILTLDYSNLTNFKLTGMDIDDDSLQHAKNLSTKLGLNKNTELFQQNAWELNLQNAFDLITSNGLNVYESDHDKVIELYKNFHRALKPGGNLVIGVITYPPDYQDKTEWILNDFSQEDLVLEQIINKDILDLKWRNFRTTKEMKSDFIQSGFTKITIKYDKYHIFPTVIAEK